MKKTKSSNREKPPSRWQKIKENPDSILYKLLLSGTKEHRCLKAIFGILWGLATGGLFFALITFSFGYDYDISGWITIGVTVLLSIGLAVSTYFRCVVLLMVPFLCTGRGRVAILATIFGVMLSGPVMNISDNANQVSNSMACTSELIYNQSQLLRKQLEEPIIEIARSIENSLDNLQAIGQSFQDVIDPVTERVEQVNRKIQEAASSLRDAARKCTQGVNQVHQQCVDGINKAKQDCEKQLGVIDRIGEGVVDTGKTIGNGVKDAIDTIGDVFGKRRKRRACHWSFPWQKHYQQSTTECSEPRRQKRFASAVCQVLDISDVCVVVKPGGALCSIVDLVQEVTDVALRETRDLIYTLTDFFEFGINSNADLYGKINSSQTAAQIMANVRADIQERTENIQKIITIIKYILAFPLLFLFIQSALYVKKYRKKDYFDNKYISTQFKHYDDKRKKQGKKSVLPLKKIEKRKYIDTRSKLLSPAELQMVKVGAVSVGLQFLITVVVIVADYVLFYVLTVMQQFGRINVSVSGDSNVSLGVVGTGFIAKMIESLLAVLEVDSDFAVNFNLTQCLPDPNEPNVNTIFVLSVLYFVAFVFIFTQAYGSRMRRKIAAYFYPAQEQERIKYLHEKIRLKRQSKLLWFSKNLKSRRKVNSILSHIPFLMFISDHVPENCNCRPKRKTLCLGCQEEFTGVSEFHVCSTPGCDGVYCMECFMEMNKKCIVCTNTSKTVKRRKVTFSKGQQMY